MIIISNKYNIYIYIYIILYIIYKQSINFIIDCQKICTTGTLNAECTLCECSNSITGRVKFGLLGLANVEIRAVNQEWSALAVTNSQGLYTKLFVCSGHLYIIALVLYLNNTKYLFIVMY